MNHSSIFAKIVRSPFLIFLIFSLGIAGPFITVSWAAEFPSKEIKLVVPYGVGGAMDISSRFLSEKVGKILGVPIVVVNNTAGGGAVGALSVVQAKPDGYTILAGSPGVCITKPMLSPELPYRYTDFTPVCMAIAQPAGIFVQNEAPWKSLKELVDYGKQNPGKLRTSVAFAGGGLHVLTELFKAEAGIDITVIPTKGGASQSTALMGGHAELCMDTYTPSITYVKAGRLRALAGTHNVPGLPMIKTFAEEGYPGMIIKLWLAIFAPKGLPKPILTNLTKAFEKALKDPSTQEQLLGTGYLLSDYQDPDETSKCIEREHEITLKLLKKAGVIK